MTAYGGACLFSRFVAKLGLPQQFVRVTSGDASLTYQIADCLMALLGGLLLGRTRQAHIADLRHDLRALVAVDAFRL